MNELNEPDVTVKQWAQDLPDIHFVSVRLSAQSAADVLEVLKQCTFDHCDADLDTRAVAGLLHQLHELKGLPAAKRVR